MPDLANFLGKRLGPPQKRYGQQRSSSVTSQWCRGMYALIFRVICGYSIDTLIDTQSIPNRYPNRHPLVCFVTHCPFLMEKGQYRAGKGQYRAVKGSSGQYRAVKSGKGQ